jgi:hypothetical protein
VSATRSAYDAQRIDADRARCWADFQRVAQAAIEGNNVPAREYIARIEARFGIEVAQRSRIELWSFVRARARPESSEPHASAPVAPPRPDAP